MTQTRLLRNTATTATIFLCLTACADGDDPTQQDSLGGTATTTPASTSSSSTTDDETTAEQACVPGSQNDCNCAGGLEGFQVCDNDGEGFGECMCASAESTTTDPGTSTGSESSSTGEPDPCGNKMCEPELEEDCASCEADCGVCAPCTLAPSCDGAEIPPANPPHATNLDDPMAYVSQQEILAQLVEEVGGGGMGARLIAAALSEPAADESALVAAFRTAFEAHPEATDAVRRQLARAGMLDPQQYSILRTAPSTAELVAFAGTRGTTTVSSGPLASGAERGLASPSGPQAGGENPCNDPRMRIRIARLDVHEEDDDLLNDEIYCAITTEGANHAEIKVTPITTPLDQGDSVDYNLDAGLIWGQAGLHAPEGNILIAYNCIESDSDTGYPALLAALGDAAGNVDGEAVGVDGWVFPAVGLVTNLLAGALTLDGDDLLFNATQVIDEANMLSLIYGAWWSVRRDGTNILSDWDWELRVEMWGCHDYGTGIPPA